MKAFLTLLSLAAVLVIGELTVAVAEPSPGGSRCYHESCANARISTLYRVPAPSSASVAFPETIRWPTFPTPSTTPSTSPTSSLSSWA